MTATIATVRRLDDRGAVALQIGLTLIGGYLPDAWDQIDLIPQVTRAELPIPGTELRVPLVILSGLRKDVAAEPSGPKIGEVEVPISSFVAADAHHGDTTGIVARVRHALSTTGEPQAEPLDIRSILRELNMAAGDLTELLRVSRTEVMPYASGTVPLPSTVIDEFVSRLEAIGSDLDEHRHPAAELSASDASVIAAHFGVDRRTAAAIATQRLIQSAARAHGPSNSEMVRALFTEIGDTEWE